MKFTKIPTDTFKKLQLNAGVLLNSFTPSTGAIDASSIIGATSGGNAFADNVTYEDYGADIDNCPKNTKELKRISEREVTMSGTFLTVDNVLGKRLAAAADSSVVGGVTKITPRDTLADADFADVWWVGDYSDENGESHGGFIAIRLIDALNTGGLQIQSGDKAKGQFAYTFTGHYTIENIDRVPYELYILEGEAEDVQYEEADTTEGFEIGVTYYTRSGSVGSYVYTRVTSGAADPDTTYYIVAE